MPTRECPHRFVVAASLALAACPAGDDRGPTSGLPVVPGTATAGATGSTTTSMTATTTTGSNESATTMQSSTTMADTQADSTADSGGLVFDVGMGGTTGGMCIPTSNEELVCDGLDDDCNGIVDEVDQGQDGICDCLSIALVGTSGSLAASQFEQWLIDRGTSAERIDPALVDAVVLDAYDVVILDQLTREYSPAEAAAFDTWVTNGGGLMAMTGHTSSPVSAQQWPNSILSIFGLEYQGALLSGPVTDFLPHPITVGLSSVTFLGGFAVVDTMPGMSQVVAQLVGPVPVAQAQVRGEGKVFVWGDEWIEYDSEWATLPEITLLWTNIFDWLTPDDVCLLPEG